MGVQKSKSKSVQPSTIVLLTDFGLQDQYAAVMKGVILCQNPLVTIVDFSHDVQPHKSIQAGYLLWSAYSYFPQGTIFVCVVDPGVGSERKIIAAQTPRYTFLAPDNGLLDAVLSEELKYEMVEVLMEKVGHMISPHAAPTFHGRDILAPIAAHLSKGTAVKELGVVREHPFVHSPFVHGPEDVTKAAVFHVDRFGNIITNIRARDAASVETKIKAVAVGSTLVSRWVRTYHDAPDNTPCLLMNSNGLVEISLKSKSAAALLTTNVETPLRVYWQ